MDAPTTEQKPASTYQLFVNAERTTFVRVWDSGTVEVARREHPSHTWGPPEYLVEEPT